MQLIYTEFLETKRLLLKLSGYKELMENYPDGKVSVELREKIVLPLLTIQQYALLKIKELKRVKTQMKSKLRCTKNSNAFIVWKY